MPNPLEKIRILDLTRLLPGGVCTLLLADMGADVIKIEDPNGGDYARWMPPLLDGQGAFFRASNRNKKSVILNLKDERGQAILHQFITQSDVLIEGFRPGVTERLNCDYATASELNPRLIYVSLSGWGQDGTYADMSGHDLNYVALGGVQGAMRNPQPIGGQIADVGGAYVGVMGILAALFKREHTGKGDYIDVSLFESGMPFAMYPFVESSVAHVPDGTGALTGGSAFYDVYYSKDKKPMALAAIEPKFWKNFCDAVQRPDWLPLHVISSEQIRLKNELTALFVTKNADDWQNLLGEADCCFTLITPPNKLHDDPHIQARDMAGIDDSGLPWMRSPVHLADSENMPMAAAPGYGEHTRSVLQSAGYNETDIDDFFAAGIIADKSQP